MRLSSNPNINKKIYSNKSNHRIISAVYVPNLDGYFRDCSEILRLFLDSLVLTKSLESKLTIINNKSCVQISNLLVEYFDDGKIDVLINQRENIGKIDAIMEVVHGCEEEFVTITDCDILFKQGWEQSVFKTFSSFKKVGSVSPIPLRGSSFYWTSSVQLQIILKKLKYSRKVLPENALDHNRYLNSIGWPSEAGKGKYWSIVENYGERAIMGSGHAVITIRSSILKKFSPKYRSKVYMGKSSETDYIDIPIDRSGMLRLSTIDNYAFHMGNTPEKWFHEVNFDRDTESLDSYEYPPINTNRKKNMNQNYWLKKKLISILFNWVYTR